MKIKLLLVLGSVLLGAASCTDGNGTFSNGQILKENVKIDRGLSAEHSTSSLVAGIWVDANRCEHWIIDDGIEGYMTTRYNSAGKPSCNSPYPAYSTHNFNRTFWGERSF